MAALDYYSLQNLVLFANGEPIESSYIHRGRMQGLIDDGLVSAAGDITPRGEAMVTMILDTPLPVQQWIDPRTEYPFTKADSAPADGLTPRQRAQRERRAREAGAPTPPYSPPPPLSVAEGSVKEAVSMPTIPPGFTAWDGSAATPPGLKPDQPVEVMRRNGKIVSKVGGDQLYAVSVNWRNNGKADDTIAYRLTTDPLDMEE